MTWNAEYFLKHITIGLAPHTDYTYECRFNVLHGLVGLIDVLNVDSAVCHRYTPDVQAHAYHTHVESTIPNDSSSMMWFVDFFVG